MEGEVKAVKAVELGADIKGSEMSNSCGDTVAMLLVELEALLMSNTGKAGEEYAVVEAPPSNAVKSSKSSDVLCKPDGLASCGSNCSLPWMFILAWGMLPVLCENKGTGGRWGRLCAFGLACKFKAADEDGADEA